MFACVGRPVVTDLEVMGAMLTSGSVRDDGDFWVDRGRNQHVDRAIKRAIYLALKMERLLVARPSKASWLSTMTCDV